MGVASDGGPIGRQTSPTNVVDFDSFVVSIEDQEGPVDEHNSIGSLGTWDTVDDRNHPQADIESFGVNNNFVVHPYRQLDQTAPAIGAHGPGGIYHQNLYTGLDQTAPAIGAHGPGGIYHQNLYTGVNQAMPTNYGTGEQGQSPFGGGTESASRPPSLRPPPLPPPLLVADVNMPNTGNMQDMSVNYQDRSPLVMPPLLPVAGVDMPNTGNMSVNCQGRSPLVMEPASCPPPSPCPSLRDEEMEFGYLSGGDGKKKASAPVKKKSGRKRGSSSFEQEPTSSNVVVVVAKSTEFQSKKRKGSDPTRKPKKPRKRTKPSKTNPKEALRKGNAWLLHRIRLKLERMLGRPFNSTMDFFIYYLAHPEIDHRSHRVSSGSGRDETATGDSGVYQDLSDTEKLGYQWFAHSGYMRVKKANHEEEE